MITKKTYINGGPRCKVTFILDSKNAEFATTAHIVGEFNDWNIYATPMKRMKDGSFTVTLDLIANREYQFRYLIDFMKWENESTADKSLPTPYGDSKNSVVVV